MVDGNDIMKSILADMQKYDAEFKENENKVAKLEQEYVAEMRKLQTRQEQLRGLYTGLYEQYKKFANEKTEAVTEVSTDTDTVSPTDSVDNNVSDEIVETAETVENAESEDTINVEEVAEALTESEIEDIKNTLNTSDKKDDSNDDIPDYLK